MNRILKKTTISILCGVIISMSIIASPIPSGVRMLTVAKLGDGNMIQNADISPHVEETTWRFRNYNGKLQMRLWSNTEGKWLTDWIDCN